MGDWKTLVTKSDRRTYSYYQKSFLKCNYGMPDLILEFWIVPVRDEQRLIMEDGSIATTVRTIEASAGEVLGSDGLTGLKIEREWNEFLNREEVHITRVSEA